ncbi:hypothetical protein IU448_12940 [Nocardia flavorosea]|uniref:WXG100 family type VII secretion target n=1 Tax=Nocardia flavorosea TaxID=53429 RepID=UPI00189466B9|nr:hypothetical protein [Nocardia flavorosea]MBF6349921.1 hypothetical protein [Nocardia flavorosea]
MTYQGQAGTTDTGTDPAYVPDREVFDAYTHQQIWDLAHERLAPAELLRAADAWGHAADTLESAFDDHARAIGRLSGEWSGSAAAAAAHAATALVLAGSDTAGVCRVLRRLMTANSDAAESVRAAIPPPPQPYRPDPDPAVEAATGAPRRTAYNAAAATATAAAQDAMTFGYNPTIAASGDSVPRFPVVVAAAPQQPGGSGGPGPRETTAPPNTEPGGTAGSRPGTTAGTEPESSQTDSPGSPASNGEEDTLPAGAPGLPGAEPQPLLGNNPAPPQTPGAVETQSPDKPTEEVSPGGTASPDDTAESPDDASGSPGDASGSPDDTAPPDDTAESPGDASGSPGDSAASPGESPRPANASESETSQYGNATAPAAGSVPDTRPAHADPAIQPAAAPVDRGVGPVGGPAATDPAPRPPAGPVGGTLPSIPAAPGPAPSGPVPTPSPGVTGGGVSAPGNSSPPGNVSGPGHPPVTNTPQQRSAPAFPEQATARPPAGHTDAVARPPQRVDREALGPAGTVPDRSGTERDEHPGQRPPRLMPAGVPLSSAGGAPPARPAGSERTSPGYLQARNEELTATDPKVPPVLGEYTDAERAERIDPGGGSR